LTNGQNSPDEQPAPTTAPNAAGGSSSTQPIPAVPPLVNPLGFIQSSLAGVTVDDLLKNKPALTMLLHDHNRLNNENGSLSNALNTANTYVRGYEDARNRAKTGAIFQAAAAIPTAFSINILTGGNAALATTGWAVLAIGVIFQGIGLYYAFWGDN
jgi:hypothetical protein